IARLTWQVTPRNKISLHWSEQYSSSNNIGGGSATSTPGANGRSLFQHSHTQQAKWSSPMTSRILLEAGWGTYQARYRNPAPRIDDSLNPPMITPAEQSRGRT